MPDDQRPRRKSTRLGDPARRPPARAASAKNPNTPKGLGDWFWLAIGAGSVVLAGLLFALIYNWNSPDAEPTNVATVDAPAVPAETTKNSVAAQDSSQRAIALRILSLGGRVTVKASGGETQEVYNSEALPSGDFSIDAVSLDGIEQATDDEVAPLTELQAMRELGLSKTKVTDAGLKDLPKATALSSVNLRGCAITDQGLQSLGKLKGLKMLIADGGMSGISTVRDFGPQSNASAIEPQPVATGTAFTDDGLRSLSGLKGLETLSLISSHAGDSGLASITRASQKLMQLRTVGFEITDGGVSSLKNLSNLRVLELSNSLITNNCIDRLCQLKKLEYLIVQGTQITPDGVKQLQQRLPKCRVFGGKYDPRLNVIREIMVLGGKVTIIPEGQPPQDLVRFEDLPEKFTVQSIDLHEVRQLWLDDLSIPEVTDLILTDAGVSPASIRRLPQLFPNLIELDLSGTGTAISDREATALTDCPKLTHADLTRTGVTDLGGKELEQKLPTADIFWGILRPSPDVEAAKWIIEIGGHVQVQERGQPQRLVDKVANLPKGPFRLRQIGAAMNSHMNDQEVQRLAGLRYLQAIHIPGLSMTDAGIAVFETTPKLTYLDFSFPAKPGITDNAMPSFRKLSRLRYLELAGIPITPEGLRRYGRTEALTFLGLDGWAGGGSGITVNDEAAKVIAEQFPNLTLVSLRRGKLTDAGLEHIAKLTKLDQLQAFGNETGGITDRGLVAISSMKGLVLLGVSGRGITDKGLESLKQLPNLKSLGLEYGCPSVTDAGVKHLVEMKSLTGVNLQNTGVTIRGFKQLREARPDIKAPEPPHLVWLQGMFKTGAKLTVATKSKKGIVVPTLDDLPKADFTIQIIDYNNNEGELCLHQHYTGSEALELRLANAKQFNGQSLYGIAHCKSLQVLDLTNTNVVDEHLKFLHGVKTLQRVNLTGTHCTAPGIAALKAALPQCEIIGP